MSMKVSNLTFSKELCINCNKNLKQNLVNKKGRRATLCYKCWCEKNNKNYQARKENRFNKTRRIDRIRNM